MFRVQIMATNLALAVIGLLVVGGCSRQKDSGRATDNRDIKAPVVSSVSASIILGATNNSIRISLVNEAGDGATEVAEIDGASCRLIQRQPGQPPVYMYFQLDPGLRFLPVEVLVTVEYFDATSGSLSIDYDSFDELSKNPAYTRTPTRVELKNDLRWHKAVFVLEKPRFEKGMRDGGDFRLALTGSQLFVRSVSVVQH